MNANDEPSLFERLIAVQPKGMTRNAWAVKAGVNRAVFTDIRNRGNASHETIVKLLDAANVTFAEYQAGTRRENEHSEDGVGHDSNANVSTLSSEQLGKVRGLQRPKDIPVVGTASCGNHQFSADEGGVEAMEVDSDDIVDYMRRPQSLENRRDVYALYFTGTSMTPKFEPGEPAFVDPKRAPAIMDYVIVQLRAHDGDDGEHVVKALAKRLVKQSADYVELEQFSPPTVFKIERKRIKAIHRIIPASELLIF